MPTPTPGNQSLLDLNVTETFQIATGQLTLFAASDDGRYFVAGGSQSGLNASNTLTYDAGTDSFILKVTQGASTIDVTFTPSDLRPDFPIPQITRYETGRVSLSLVKAGAEGSGLSYVTYGSWSTFNGFLETGQLVFGIRTALDSMPKTGSANFTGHATGSLVEGNGGYQYGVLGEMSLTANFGAGTLSGEFAHMTKSKMNSTEPWEDFRINAAINGNTFGGAMQSKRDLDMTGPVSGGFFGPGAAEIGGSWAVSNGSDQAVGVFTGKKN